MEVEVRQESLPDLRTQAEITAQIEIAHQRPRSIKKFMQDALDMATLNEDVAGSCIYALPRGGKSIEGPSARLAEIVVSAWGNAHAGARVIGEDAKFVTAQGVARDLERNVTITFEVRRRITNKKGERFNDDLIAVTANAAASIALRNAVFKMVPKAFWDGIYEEARKAAVGDVRTIETKRANMIDHFGKMGVTEERIIEMLGVPGREDIGAEELIRLRGVATALKDGDISVDTAFPVVYQSDAPRPSSKTEAIKRQLAAAEDAPAEAPVRPATEPAPDAAPSTGEPESVGETQLKALKAAGKGKGYKVTDVTRFAQEAFGVKKLDELTPSQASQLIAGFKRPAPEPEEPKADPGVENLPSHMDDSGVPDDVVRHNRPDDELPFN